MKKIFMVILVAIFSQQTFSQVQHGIKVDANFASASTGGVNYGSEMKSTICPGISYSMLAMGENWGYIMDFGYSQSGFSEVLNNGVIQTLKVSNLDWNLIGVQYAFLNDWAQIRPVIQTKLGLRLSFPDAVITTSAGINGTQTLENIFDVTWSVGVGAIAFKHALVTLSYGGGFLDYLMPASGWRHNQVQLSATYFF
jgi:hypothetical protein